MTYDLFIGHKTYSSWSLRGWLMLRKFDLPFQEHMVGLYGGTMAEDMAPLAPARLVPTLRLPDGTIVGESLAMAETLAERHPDAGLWPSDSTARARARWLVSEMHAGFGALRGDCPMQLSYHYQGFTPSAAVLADLARLQELWSLARNHHGAEGPWLFGRYSLADVFYAPVAMRIAGYGLPVSDAAAAYVQAHLDDPAIKEWRDAGAQDPVTPEPYLLDLPKRRWADPD